MLRGIVSILIAMLVVNVASAQDPQFSQFYSAPMYLNPGFAGNTVQARGVMNYRNQWPSMPRKFVSFAASYDYNLDQLNSGIALAFQQDRAGSAGLRYSNVAVHYSYTLRLSRTFAIKPGMYFSYTFRDINQSELVFGDQLIYDNPTSASQGRFTLEPVRYPDIGTGAIAYQKRWWGGVAFHHINQPNQSLISLESRLPMRLTVHGGYNLILSRNIKRKEISSATVVGHYKSQRKWDQFDFGVYYRYKVITAGAYYRNLVIKRNGYAQPNHDAFILLLGIEYKNLGFGYSYDITTSKLITNSGGAHELSLVWELASDRKKRKRRRSRYLIPCAKF
ncbi:MAG: PorP/SprF family type IX secretion system membrane protein [Flavobacteriales bacterium]|nr:PorP/SprF family type IX secretion system membrane protein [Flavobacteriales bacterium]MBT5132032.1 PorP/SprF family type IX secretion system membrane protein [Flavobacteriales bacterium]MBT6133578.1 PorP/SprF family type IX secretion system membrane protein [Flavobacteriales bacterium]